MLAEVGGCWLKRCGLEVVEEVTETSFEVAGFSSSYSGGVVGEKSS